MSAGQAALWLGMAVLAHSAYSVSEHRSYLVLLGRELTSIPIDIVLETVFGLLLAVSGIVLVAGKLEHISLDAPSNRRLFDSEDNPASFRIFSHRGNKANSASLSSARSAASPSSPPASSSKH